MSKHKKTDLIVTVAQALPRLQEATDAIDEAAARILGVNRTDLRALGILQRVGSVSAGTLAEATGLTRGAMTTALDRLQQAGLVHRVRDTEDRRGVRVEMTKRAIDRCNEIWGPLAREGVRLLEKYSTDELTTILHFLEAARVLQEAHVTRIK